MGSILILLMADGSAPLQVMLNLMWTVACVMEKLCMAGFYGTKQVVGSGVTLASVGSLLCNMQNAELTALKEGLKGIHQHLCLWSLWS